MPSMLPRCCRPRKSIASQEWTEIKSTPEHLLEEMLGMYWMGVRVELTNILLTHYSWSQGTLAAVRVDDENDDPIRGFDTFIDQVCEGPRRRAFEHAESLYSTGRSDINSISGETTNIKSNVKAKLAERTSQDVRWRRAKMLLQSAGFLDIDKNIQYRPPPVERSFWKTPRPPQLALKSFDRFSMPRFKALPCSTCSNVIRGIMFRCTKTGCTSDKQLGPSDFICEDCYREARHPQSHMVKSYKHCILREVIDTDKSRKICQCSTVERYNGYEDTISLFPVDATSKHRVSAGARCGLFNLGDRISEAKREGQLLKFARRKQTDEQVKPEVSSAPGRSAPLPLDMRQSNSKTKAKPEPTKNETVDKETDKGVPFWLKKYVKKYPFGNVHVSLIIGSIVIENGIPGTNGGAFISCREPFHFQIHRDAEDLKKTLSISSERTLYSQMRKERLPRRLKACMKQAVGGAFAGYLDSDLETDIINILVEESARYKYDPRTTITVQNRKLNGAVDRLFVKTKEFLEPRARRLLGVFAKKLFDPNVRLRFDQKEYNCQNFCDALMDFNRFGRLFGEQEVGAEEVDQAEEPLYLMSFVCRPESYVEATPNTKFDVPNGLTAEYLLKFRYGRHDDADIADTLQEYWHDWGNFGGHLYRYQDLFPWDCTEAWDKDPEKCNDCNISKHVWSFPFDSWSIIQLHLQKDRRLYPAPNEQTDQVMSEVAWMRNRLKVLLAQDVLISTAVEMATTSELRNATAWLHQSQNARNDRLKMGAIHRAQPWSHQYEKGQYHEYFVADWVHLRREDQIKAYESLRDFRQALPDIPRSWSEVWSRGFELRDDPFEIFPNWFDNLMFDLHDLGIPVAHSDDLHTMQQDYTGLVSGVGVEDGKAVGDIHTSVQNGHFYDGQDHSGSSPLDNSTGATGDFHTNADASQGDMGHGDLQPGTTDIGPALGGGDLDGTGFSSHFGDSSSNLLGHQSDAFGNHHGIHTMGGFGTFGGGSSGNGTGFGLVRPTRRGIGFGLGFLF